VAQATGRALHDVRVPEVTYPIADGKRRTGKRCLAVGTDCSVGKMYTAMAMDAEMRRRGLPATFRATGQTGILITGDGVPLDAVVADFMAGAVEWLTPDNDPAHWDLIEGQGSLFHPSYSGVTLALIHGGQPDALILSHEPTRRHLRGLPHFPLRADREPRRARDRRLAQHPASGRGRGAGRDRADRGADGPACGRPVPAGGRAAGRCADVGISPSRAGPGPRRGCCAPR